MSDRVRELAELIRATYPNSKLTTLPHEALASLQHAHVGLPDDYLHLLGSVGWGNVGSGRYSLYSGPVAAAEMFPGHAGLEGLFLVGDDFAGTMAAYDTNSRPWSFIVLDHCAPSDATDRPYTTLAEFLIAELT